MKRATRSLTLVTKRPRSYYTIVKRCINCSALRKIAKQDRFIVKRCKRCQTLHARKLKRLRMRTYRAQLRTSKPTRKLARAA